VGRSTFESSITSLIKAATESPGFGAEIPQNWHRVGLAHDRPALAQLRRSQSVALSYANGSLRPARPLSLAGACWAHGVDAQSQVL